MTDCHHPHTYRDVVNARPGTGNTNSVTYYTRCSECNRIITGPLPNREDQAMTNNDNDNDPITWDQLAEHGCPVCQSDDLAMYSPCEGIHNIDLGAYTGGVVQASWVGHTDMETGIIRCRSCWAEFPGLDQSKVSYR